VEHEHVIRRGVAEALGTGAIVFVAAGAIIAGNDRLAVAAAYGIVVAVMISAFGHVSGGHFNPVVTAGLMLTRRIEPAMGIIYMICQFVGSVIAATLLRAVFDDVRADAVNLGAPSLGEGVSLGEGFTMELILTFLVVLVFFATAVDGRGAYRVIAGFGVGSAVFAAVLVGLPVSGAAMNPARAFGPQLVGNSWSDGWIYYVACPLAALLAALLYDRVYLRGHRVETAGSEGSGLEEVAVERAADE
jgi:aquaporin Z